MCGNFFKPSSESFLGGSLGQTIVQAGLGAFGMPYLAAGLGGLTGLAQGKGIMGGITGALSGYGAGQLGGNISGFFGGGGGGSSLFGGGGGESLFGGAGDVFGGGNSFSNVFGNFGGGPDMMAGFQSAPGTINSFGSGLVEMGGGGGGLGFTEQMKRYMSNMGLGGPGGMTGKGLINGIQSIGSGLYGMKQSGDMRSLVSDASRSSDPWGTSGGRANAAAQLQQLNTNPSAAMLSDPRFLAMRRAAERSTAPMGQGSGAMATAAAGAGGNWYTQRLQELGQLGGANINPGQASQLMISGNESANRLAGDSLASIGFGVNGMMGGPGALPPAVRQQIMQRYGVQL